jgi:hypothetical protein
MIKLFTILTVIFLLTLSSVGQITSTSRLYKSNGRLIADTTFNISQQQLLKWTTIEDSLTKNILEKLYYPVVSRETNVAGKLIISFTLDTTGRFNDFYIEKYYMDFSPDTGDVFIKNFMKSSFYATKYFSGVFVKNGFKSDKDIIEKYYLPVDFHLNPNDTYRQIKYGWLILDNKEIIIVH